MPEDPKQTVVPDGSDFVSEPIPSYSVPLPEQKGFFKIPARFGHVPVAEEPLGYDKERRFEHFFPRVDLPFQLVETIRTDGEALGDATELLPVARNRLVFGDSLHVMRMLPSESIDLIYIDPPFFSGRNYNIIFGDKNEVRSFSDIWEGGMPGYLIWLNARLYEMKRLLKATGSIFVHLDWHAAHYVKIELDKIFGNDCFQNEIIWLYRRWPTKSKSFQRMHDTILFYSKRPGGTHKFNLLFEPASERTLSDYEGKRLTTVQTEDGTWVKRQTEGESEGVPLRDVWEIKRVHTRGYERIGYPTQKPIELMQRIVDAASQPGDVVADFFMGGGSFIEAAMGTRMYPDAKGIPTKRFEADKGRRWIGCDVSRVAVALTADRLARILAPNLEDARRSAKRSKASAGSTLFSALDATPATDGVNPGRKAVRASPLRLPGFTVEHWGIYEITQLTRMTAAEFRAFALACYGARKWTGSDPNIHGVKGSELLWIAGPKETDVVSASDVKLFAEAVIKTRRAEERQAVMIGWSIDPKARAYAEQIMALGEQKPIQFIKLRLWPLAGEEFKAHVTKKHDKYRDFFAFILPPDIPRIGVTRVSERKYRFDVSEARSMNTGGKIVNVQWDFDFRDGIFSATQGYQLCRVEKKGRGQAGFEGDLTVEYEFEGVRAGDDMSIACRVQDDLGGEGMKSMKVRIA